MGEKNRAEPSSNIDNRLRGLRAAKGLSQGALAGMAGITRQAVYAIEANQYLPTTAVALRLARALDCRVEDLFNLVASGEVVDGEWIGRPPENTERTRVKVARVGDRLLVRPVSQLGDVLNFTVPADGLLVPGGRDRKSGHRVRVELLRDRRLLEEEIVVAGCDPAIFLAGDYLRRRQERASVVGWTMGSAAALEALKRGEVHVAGLHIVDAKSGESNLPYLRRHLKGDGFTVVTFAAWEEGFIVQRGNPKGIHDVSDLARKDVEIVNREGGAGARLLLDQKLSAAGIQLTKIKGYGRMASSHLHVAHLVAMGQADVGLSVRAAARLVGLDFIPLQEERYDLVMPTRFLATHPALAGFLDTIVSRAFRIEIDALGGYDTRETGKIQDLRGSPHPIAHGKPLRSPR
ncbi:MAG TPA: substrate-binding domain-containing protein [Nitrospiraceae bacterium]|nr:substrate-binding domain-containing protein [Nitrospiraceae bacterium]